MKLHFYILDYDDQVHYQAAEVKETPTMYKLIDNVHHYYHRTIAKTEIGKIVDNYLLCVVLTEPDFEKAKDIMIEYLNKKLLPIQKQLENIKNSTLE
jgi:hypothetical protein